MKIKKNNEKHTLKSVLLTVSSAAFVFVIGVAGIAFIGATFFFQDNDFIQFKTLFGWAILGGLVPVWSHHLSKKRYINTLSNTLVEKLESTLKEMDNLVNEVILSEGFPVFSKIAEINLESLSCTNEKLKKQVNEINLLRKFIKRRSVSVFTHPKQAFLSWCPSDHNKDTNVTLKKLRQLTTKKKSFKKHKIGLKKLISKEQLKLLNRYNLEY